MDWVVQALLVIMAQIQVIGLIVMDALGMPAAGQALIELGALLFAPDAFADYPESLERAAQRINEVLR